MKKKVIIIVPIAILLLAVGIVLFQSNKNVYGASIGAACSAIKYEENAKLGYLTLTFEREEGKTITKTFKVEDRELRDQMAQTDLADVIGVQLIINLSNKIIKKHNVDSSELNADFWFETNIFDDYFTVVNISLNESPT